MDIAAPPGYLFSKSDGRSICVNNRTATATGDGSDGSAHAWPALNTYQYAAGAVTAQCVKEM